MTPELPLLPLVALPPNRVRRNYLGGALLDGLEGVPVPRDSARPEDWIASTTRAMNPGLSPKEDEGLSLVRTSTGETCRLMDLFAAAPDYYLGAAHAARRGPHLGFLAKLLDSSIRLHVQAHPTAEFARKHLHSEHGKLEAYVILAARENVSPYIRLGFQRPPTAAEWKRIILEQDIAAMDACFDPVPIRPGEVWLVTGGLPHAIGEGVLMLEVMEPTDLVVRCEFERAGIVVPPAARFMNRDPDFALQIFDYTPLSVAEVTRQFRIAPQRPSETAGIRTEQLITRTHTGCFSISRMTVGQPAELPAAGHARIAIVAGGTGAISAGAMTLPLRPAEKVLLPAAGPIATVVPAGGPLELLVCSPGGSFAGGAKAPAVEV